MVGRWFSTLRVRLMALALVASLPAVGLLVMTTADQRSTAIARAQADARGLAGDLADEHERHVEGARQLLMTLAKLPSVHNGDTAGCTSMLKEVLTQFRSYANLAVARADGDVICSALPLKGSVNIADRLYFRRTLETRAFVVGEYQVGRVTGKPTVSLSYPMFDAGERPTGIVLAALDLGWLEREVSSLPLPPETTVTVFDHAGVVLARHPSRPGGVGVVVSTAIFSATRRQGEDTLELADLDGRSRLFALRPLGRSGLGGVPWVAVGIPREVALAVVNQTLVRNLLGLSVAIALIVGLAWVAGDAFVRRQVLALVAATRKLGAGDLRARIGAPYGHGELGELATAFDETAASVERLTGQTRLILSSVDEGIYGLDHRGRVMFVNPAALRLTGYAAEELLGEPMHVKLHHAHADGTPYPPDQCPTAEVMRSGVARQVYDEVFWRKDGSCFPVEYISGPLRDGTEIVGAVVAFHDVTERKRAHEELQRHREALHQSEKVATLGSLLAGVAHELNNPLAVLIGQATLLKMAAHEGPFAERSAKIQKAAERCTRIVRNFLALARKHAPERTNVLVNSIVQEAIELLAYELRTSNVQVAVELADGLPVLQGDSHRIHQVLVNLIANAHHAMRDTPGERRLTVRTRATALGAGVQIEVADTGPGIPPDVVDRIFEPFFTTKPPGEGTGLGLSLCRGIVEEHYGTLSVQSAPGAGARFVIDLPVTGPEGRLAEAVIEAPPARVEPQKVLVVDDEPDIAATLAEMLGQDGHRADTAPEGAAALAMLERHAYDLVLCDSQMAGVDGVALYREVERRFPRLRHRFVFLTGDTLRAEKGRLLCETGAPFLSKPFDLEEVRGLVRRVVGTAEGARG